jgi:hypothetical protein
MDKPTTPKPGLPLDVLKEVAKIERDTREILDGIRDASDDFGLLLDVPKIREVMRAGASESFIARAKFYQSQPHCRSEWLKDVVGETASAIWKLAPFLAVLASEHDQEAIATELRADLEAVRRRWTEARRLSTTEQGSAVEPSGDEWAGTEEAHAPTLAQPMAGVWARLAVPQKELLALLVAKHNETGGEEFFFIRHLGGNGLSYPGGPFLTNLPYTESDFCRLSLENLIDAVPAGEHVLRGRPTELGIRLVAFAQQLETPSPELEETPPPGDTAPTAEQPAAAQSEQATIPSSERQGLKPEAPEPIQVELEIPGWLKAAGRVETANQSVYSKGSMDRFSQADPIWRITATQKGPIPITRLNGEVVWFDDSATREPDDAVLTPEDEQRIAEVTLSGRSELRSEIEKLFSGPDWPLASVIVEPLRRYAIKVFDVNAAAYRNVASTQAKAPHDVLNAMLRNLFSGLLGREWENSPGETVTRTDWQHGVEGWKGREFVMVAGNAPDPTCEYHQLISDAIKYRYRFHAPLPAPIPGEPPGINLSNVEWWKYIGLNERHNLAMAIRPYLEDRRAHWQSICASVPQPDAIVQSSPLARRLHIKPQAWDQGVAKAERAQRLAAARNRWRPIVHRVPFAWIHRAVGVDHKDAYNWKSGKLPDTSTMAQGIERVLRQQEPPVRPITD